MLARPPFFSAAFLAWLGCITAFVAVPVLTDSWYKFPGVMAVYAVSLLARFFWPRRPRMIQPEVHTLGARLPWLGIGMSVVLIAIYWLTLNATTRPFGLVPYGANFPIWWPQIYRLPTANLLHMDLGHLASNCAVLILVSVWGQSLGVWLGSGLLASVVAAIVLRVDPHAAYIVGASGFVFAALGAWRFPFIRADQRTARLICFVFLVAHCAINLYGDHISMPMHLAGLAAGFLLTRLWVPTLPLILIYVVSVVVAFANANVLMEKEAVREYAQVATNPDTLLPLADYYVAEAQATNAYLAALNRVRPMVGEAFYQDPPPRERLLTRFAELLVLAWKRGISSKVVAGREACGVVIEAHRVIGVFCGAPQDDAHVVVWVGDPVPAMPYKRWPVR